MNMNRYRILLLVNLALVLVVMALFRWIHDREIAALIAGFLFLVSPSVTVWTEWRKIHRVNTAAGLTALIFLSVSALPIFLLRVLNWGVPFEQLSLLGFTGPQMHQAANGFFFLMLAGLWWGSLQMKKTSS